MKYSRRRAVLSAIITALLVAACGDDEAVPAPVDPVEAGPLPGDASASDAGADATVDPEVPQTKYGVLDRAGKAYVSMIFVSLPNREAYNEAPVEEVDPQTPLTDGGAPLGADFQSTLVKLDAMDGKVDWNGGAGDAGHDAGVYPHPLTNAFIAADALLLNPNKAFSATGYLDLEMSGAAATTSGGRWMNDDALSKTMSYVVKRSLTGVSDNVAAPAKPATPTFPYLAAPF